VELSSTPAELNFFISNVMVDVSAGQIPAGIIYLNSYLPESREDKSTLLILVRSMFIPDGWVQVPPESWLPKRLLKSIEEVLSEHNIVRLSLPASFGKVILNVIMAVSLPHDTSFNKYEKMWLPAESVERLYFVGFGINILLNFHSPPVVEPADRKLFRFIVSWRILHRVEMLSLPALIWPTEIVVLKGKAHAVGIGVKFKVKVPVPEVTGLKDVIGLPFNDHEPDIEFMEEGRAIGAPFIHVGPRGGGVKVMTGNTFILVGKLVTQFFVGVKIKG
jgi:hypothetical protein